MEAIAHIVLGAALDAFKPQGVVDVGLAPFTVLGAGMGFWSGLLGMLSMATGGDSTAVGRAVDRGIAIGFFLAAPFAALTFVSALISL